MFSILFFSIDKFVEKRYKKINCKCYSFGSQIHGTCTHCVSFIKCLTEPVL